MKLPVKLPVVLTRCHIWSETINAKGRQMRKILLVAATFLLPFLAAVPVAQASSPNICGNAGSGYCINAWNGGPYVKMYYGGYSNDNFYLRDVSVCSGSARVQSTRHGDATDCPFTNPNLDSLFWNDRIVEAVYGNNGECVGTTASGTGFLGSCGSSDGTGAINGAFNALHYYSGCGYALANRYWSNQFSNQYYWVSGGNPGTPLYLNGQDSWTCWGGSGI
jgi:hypothetical protein